jgi:hypothetical protein
VALPTLAAVWVFAQPNVTVRPVGASSPGLTRRWQRRGSRRWLGSRCAREKSAAVMDVKISKATALPIDGDRVRVEQRTGPVAEAAGGWVLADEDRATVGVDSGGGVTGAAAALGGGQTGLFGGAVPAEAWPWKLRIRLRHGGLVGLRSASEQPCRRR